MKWPHIHAGLCLPIARKHLRSKIIANIDCGVLQSDGSRLDSRRENHEFTLPDSIVPAWQWFCNLLVNSGFETNYYSISTNQIALGWTNNAYLDASLWLTRETNNPHPPATRCPGNPPWPPSHPVSPCGWRRWEK
jgi:hypothetical protein